MYEGLEDKDMKESSEIECKDITESYRGDQVNLSYWRTKILLLLPPPPPLGDE